MSLIVTDGSGNPIGEAMMTSEGRMVVVADGELVATTDEKFVRAGHESENRACNHAQWSFQKHGRYCPCGTCMVDFGD